VTVLFDEYGNEETHLLEDLKIRTEEDEEETLEINEPTIDID
jgi:hypothetical protein